MCSTYNWQNSPNFQFFYCALWVSLSRVDSVIQSCFMFSLDAHTRICNTKNTKTYLPICHWCGWWWLNDGEVEAGDMNDIYSLTSRKNRTSVLHCEWANSIELFSLPRRALFTQFVRLSSITISDERNKNKIFFRYFLYMFCVQTMCSISISKQCDLKNQIEKGVLSCVWRRWRRVIHWNIVFIYFISGYSL